VNVFLFDGTYELFRSHFGAPPATSPHDGTEVGASIGFAASLIAHLREHPDAGAGVAFDQVIESFRNRLFPGYKTGEGVDPALLGQFPLAAALASGLGMVVWSMVEFEADDALATAADRLARDPAVESIWIATPDKDLAQCVGGRVRTLDRRRGISLDRDGVIAKFGVPPEAIPDYLALVGDSADGIPGLRGWGPASSAGLLSAYGRIEAIPARATDWSVRVRGAETLASRLDEQREQALLYRELATLRRDVPIEVELESLQWRGADPVALPPLLEHLGAETLAERIPKWRSQ
jgi:5'-3' exonuclease